MNKEFLGEHLHVLIEDVFLVQLLVLWPRPDVENDADLRKQAETENTVVAFGKDIGSSAGLAVVDAIDMVELGLHLDFTVELRPELAQQASGLHGSHGHSGGKKSQRS